MTITRPTVDDVRAAALEIGIHFTESEAVTYHALMQGQLDAYDFVDGMQEPLPAVTYPRSADIQPDPEDNPFNAWAVKATIKGAPEGKLAGKRVAIKDNVCVAGLRMMNGATILDGYVPEIDATIVQRILDAGGDILGKSVCEYYCASGGSHTSANGYVDNPLVPGHNAGGSSSGSTALVMGGIVDMATGGDQGGSVRIPASYCGAVGLKPTHGLVPYTGIFAVEMTLDHAGTITRTVADNALMLEAIAGPDGLDPRQSGAPAQPYTQALGQGVEGLRVGIVPEGFGTPGAETEVDDRVLEAADKLADAGAIVSTVSIPLHSAGAAIWTPIFLEGTFDLMMRHNAYGTNMKGVFLDSLRSAQSAWKDRADELSDTMKLGMLTGHYMASRHQGRFYGKAQNLNRLLTAEYERALSQVDVLLMPTTPMATTPMPAKDAGPEEVIGRAFEMVGNTAPTCATGHPAISVPVGTTSDGRPIGGMLIARHLDEMTLFRAAEAMEACYR
ncbi:amidase [Salipiger sp. 1_MG-2023]|uniref:amidase n=1 Tax=Salipiger sp. 1_MG-2023 TaxID=3062665 RepID=UPI0026E204D9|nr:amidase [Salipiger sp. 1_MG-2023]MDO6588316.1 amidase [Salipiger sp. 1_MG-2023]